MFLHRKLWELSIATVRTEGIRVLQTLPQEKIQSVWKLSINTLFCAFMDTLLPTNRLKLASMDNFPHVFVVHGRGHAGQGRGLWTNENKLCDIPVHVRSVCKGRSIEVLKVVVWRSMAYWGAVGRCETRMVHRHDDMKGLVYAVCVHGFAWKGAFPMFSCHFGHEEDAETAAS